MATGRVPAGIEVLLLSFDALAEDDSYRIRPLRLREAAPGLAHTLTELEVDADFDAATEELLSIHIDEVAAREGAQALAPLTLQEVEQKVNRSGRFTRQLKPVQLKNLGTLLRLRHGANFSVPGAGKTSTALATYESFRAEGRVNRLLVVAPKNAFLAWEDEVERCYENVSTRPRVERLTGGQLGTTRALQSAPEIAIVSYQLLPNVLPLVESWVRAGRTHVVLDESHRIKSGTTGLFSGTAMLLAEGAVRRDVLSGTPMPQSAEDLRSQFQFLWPGQSVLPPVPLRRDVDPILLEQVQNAVAPLYTRTTKDDLDLPPIEVEQVAIKLGPLQRELYDLLRSEARRVAVGLGGRDRQFFRNLGKHVMRLLEAASNPMLLASGTMLDDDLQNRTEAGARAFELLRECARREEPAKIADLRRRVDDSAGEEKILIWTSFTQNILYLEKVLSDWNPVIIYGDVATGSEEDDTTREARIKRFHVDDSCRVMIANPSACGEGISLHKACHHAIYLDRTFNAAHYLQSVDRIHRLGLDEDTVTRVDILEAAGTVDSRVASRVWSKIQVMSQILNDHSLEALAYDPEDIEEEFPAGLQPEDVEEVLQHLEGVSEDSE